MVWKIRGYDKEDDQTLYDICLQTGDSGRDARTKFQIPTLIGDIYAGPYMRLAPDLVFVAEDEEGVAGYIVGVLDSVEWARKLERDWWPTLRKSYPLKDWEDEAISTYDRHCITHFHQPHDAPMEVVSRFPAHIHMNLLPRLQGKGIGGRMLRRWFDIALHHGVRSVHLGVSPKNTRGRAFWQKRGFVPLVLSIPDTEAIWMGQDLD